jgi:energy-coupling factor transporter ATP-binding protein EcfA2
MSDENKKDEPKVQADNNSIAVGNISAGGNIGDININTGYTANQVSVLITQIQSTFQPKPFDGRCPYKGLDVFEEEDAELFFGREKLVDDLVSRVKDSRTVFVTGPSGSGKSSLVRAGLIHAMKQGAIKGSERWLYATMKPGRDPIGELGRVIASLASSTNPEDEIRTKAMKDASIFARWCEIVLKEGRDKRLVLFIDQFEEVFTQISKEEERITFLNLLTHAATIENGRVIILFSMRSDFVSNCATYPQLNELLSKQFRQIGAMQPEELVSAIAQPALRVGLRIDPDLIAQIINEMKGEPGALPLMQFALKDLFDSQQEKSGVIALTLNDHLQRGGIHKALERHADDAFSNLSKNEQELARSIFSGLIEIGRGTQDTKRTAMFDELVPAKTKAEDVEAIVQKLADARLITTDEQAGNDTVTISHEKLLTAWTWLRKLVDENRDVIAVQNEIINDAREWDENKRDDSFLYRGARLANAREKLNAKKLSLSGPGMEFVQAGEKAYTDALEQEKKRADELQRFKNNAIARQLTSEAQSLYAANSNQMISALLCIQSLKLYPNAIASSFLINNNRSATLIARMKHDLYVISVAFSPDGKYAASGSGDKTARVWEAVSGKEITRITHEEAINSVKFSPDGKYIASGSDDKTVQVREITTGKEIVRVKHDDGVTSVTFSSDGRWVVSGSKDKTARVWDAITGKNRILEAR